MSGVPAWWRTRARPQARRALPLVAVAAALAPLLAGCGNSIDGEQLRLCRSVISGAQSRWRRDSRDALRAVRARLEGVRIEYVARPPGEASHVRYVACGFAGRTFSADALDLVAVETDSGPLGDARALLSQALLARRPGRVRAKAPRRRRSWCCRPRSAYVAQQFINASALSAVYALLATAYSLVYGITGRINLAFGEIAMLGAYGRSAGLRCWSRSASMIRSPASRSASRRRPRSPDCGAPPSAVT